MREWPLRKYSHCVLIRKHLKILHVLSKLVFRVDHDADAKFLVSSFCHLQKSVLKFQLFTFKLYERKILNFTLFLSTFNHYLFDCKVSESCYIPALHSEFLKIFALFVTLLLSANFETKKSKIK